AVILVPSDWASSDNLDIYFPSKRWWFYPVFLLASIADLVSSLLKGGWWYVLGMGVMPLVFTAAAIPVCVVGVLSTNIRVYSFMAVVFFLWLVIVGFEIYPSLNS